MEKARQGHGVFPLRSARATITFAQQQPETDSGKRHLCFQSSYQPRKESYSRNEDDEYFRKIAPCGNRLHAHHRRPHCLPPPRKAPPANAAGHRWPPAPWRPNSLIDINSASKARPELAAGNRRRVLVEDHRRTALPCEDRLKTKGFIPAAYLQQDQQHDHRQAARLSRRDNRTGELEHRAGIEPANTGFADQRVSHFATGALFPGPLITGRLQY